MLHCVLKYFECSHYLTLMALFISKGTLLLIICVVWHRCSVILMTLNSQIKNSFLQHWIKWHSKLPSNPIIVRVVVCYLHKIPVVWSPLTEFKATYPPDKIWQSHYQRIYDAEHESRANPFVPIQSGYRISISRIIIWFLWFCLCLSPPLQIESWTN